MEEAEALADIVRDETLRVLPPQNAYGRKDVVDAQINASLRCYLTALFDQREHDLLRGFHVEETDWVDDYDGAVEGALARLHEIVGARLKCPADLWEDVVRHAATRTVRFVVDPRVALAAAHEAAAMESEAVPCADLRTGLRFFNAYPSLLASAATRLERRTGPITGPEYASLIDNAIKDAFGGYRHGDWATEAAPLYDLYRIETGSSAVPIRVLENLLQAFGATETRTNVQAYAARARLSALSAEQFERACSGDDVVTTAEEPPVETAPAANTAKAGDLTPANATPAPSTGPVPLWRQFQSKLNAPIGADEKPPHRNPSNESTLATTATPKAAKTESKREHQPSARDDLAKVAEPQQTFRFDADPSPAPEVEEPTTQPIWTRYKSQRKSDAEILISADVAESVLFQRLDRTTHDRYVKSLFNGSEQAYRTVLSRLANAPNWAEASAIIARDVFRRYRVNIYSEVAVSFTNAVEQHFRASSAPSS